MVLTFALGPRVRVVKVVALGERRGPSAEAQTLYDEIDSARPESLARGPASR